MAYDIMSALEGAFNPALLGATGPAAGQDFVDPMSGATMPGRGGAAGPEADIQGGFLQQLLRALAGARAERAAAPLATGGTAGPMAEAVGRAATQAAAPQPPVAGLPSAVGDIPETMAAARTPTPVTDSSAVIANLRPFFNSAAMQPAPGPAPAPAPVSTRSPPTGEAVAGGSGINPTTGQTILDILGHALRAGGRVNPTAPGLSAFMQGAGGAYETRQADQDRELRTRLTTEAGARAERADTRAERADTRAQQTHDIQIQRLTNQFQRELQGVVNPTQASRIATALNGRLSARVRALGGLPMREGDWARIYQEERDRVLQEFGLAANQRGGGGPPDAGDAGVTAAARPAAGAGGPAAPAAPAPPPAAPAAPAGPPAAPAGPGQQPQRSAENQQRQIARARQAIAGGMPRQQVINALRTAGIEPPSDL